MPSDYWCAALHPKSTLREPAKKARKAKKAAGKTPAQTRAEVVETIKAEAKFHE